MPAQSVPTLSAYAYQEASSLFLAYQGPKFQTALAQVCRSVNIEIVRRCDTGRFVVLSKRWIVERTIAWLNRCRRLSKDWECLNRNALAFLRWASVRLMLRRLCRA